MEGMSPPKNLEDFIGYAIGLGLFIFSMMVMQYWKGRKERVQQSEPMQGDRILADVSQGLRDTLDAERPEQQPARGDPSHAEGDVAGPARAERRPSNIFA